MKLHLGRSILTGGRLCNRIITYVMAKELAEHLGASIEVAPWVGDLLFNLDDKRPDALIWTTDSFLDAYERRKEIVSIPPCYEFPESFRGPRMRRCVFKRHLQWRSWYKPMQPAHKCVVHVRRGDFLTDTNGSWPIIPLEKIIAAVSKCGFDNPTIIVEPNSQSDTNAWPFGMLWDFHNMIAAENLFVYPGSSFSHVAALLGNGRAFMPTAGVRGECEFEYSLVEI